MKTFLARFASLIHFVLSGFDRLRFRGESTPSSLQPAALIPISIGNKFVTSISPTIVRKLPLSVSVRKPTNSPKSKGVPVRHLNSRKSTRRQPLLNWLKPSGSAPAGRIALISAVESCFTYRLRKNREGRVYPVKTEGKCKHYYHYFQHFEWVSVMSACKPTSPSPFASASTDDGGCTSSCTIAASVLSFRTISS